MHKKIIWKYWVIFFKVTAIICSTLQSAYWNIFYRLKCSRLQEMQSSAKFANYKRQTHYKQKSNNKKTSTYGEFHELFGISEINCYFAASVSTAVAHKEHATLKEQSYS